MPEISWLIVITGALGNFIIGLTTYLRAPRSATNIWFGIFSLLFAAYLVINQFSIVQDGDASTLFWIRAVMIIAPAIVFVFFVLVNVFPGKEMHLSKKIFIGSLIATILIMILGSTSLIFHDVIPGTNQPVPGKLVFLFPVYNILFLGWSIIVLINKFRKASGIEKTQLKYLIFGAVAMFSLILLSNVIMVIVFNISSFVVLVPIYTLIFVGLTSYAIVRFGLFDVKVIATEATTVVLWVILFSKIFAAQDSTEVLVDLAVFLVTVVFGMLLVRSVRREVAQRKQLQELNRRLEELDAKKDEFLNVASHELRAPMTAIRGYLSMVIGEDGGEIPGEASSMLREASEEADRMVRLINNMLDVARIEEGRMVFEEGDVNLSNVVRRAYEETRFEAEEKSLEFIYNSEEGVHDRVHVDVDRIHEVVGNLINNAVKYTDQGSVHISLTNPTPDRIRMDVVDTGPGISTEEQKRLFEKFFRAESYAGKKIGTGLGLYISKLLVERFGGTIGFSSKEGKGSTFWFELPVKKG